MSSGFDEEETIGNVRTDCLYKHDFKNGAGSFFNLVTDDDEGTTTVEYHPIYPIRNRVKFSATFIRVSGEIQSVTIKKFRQYVTKGLPRWEEQRWGPEDPLRLSHLTFEKLISFINLLTKNDLVNLNQRRLALRTDPGVTIDPETRWKVGKLLQQPDGLSIVDELLRNGSITSRDLVNLGYRKNQLLVFKRMLIDPDGLTEYQFNSDIPESQVEKAWQHFFERNEWIFGYGLDYRFLGVLQREARVGNEDLAGRDGSISDFLMSAGKFTVIVELKRPDTPLFDRGMNRSGSWKLSSKFVDAVSQILEQKAAWQIRAETNLAGNFTNGGDLIEQATADPKAILIVGSDADFSGSDKEQAIKRRTFELFRRDSRNVEILTYDELYERAKFIVGHAEQAGASA